MYGRTLGVHLGLSAVINRSRDNTTTTTTNNNNNNNGSRSRNTTNSIILILILTIITQMLFVNPQTKNLKSSGGSTQSDS